MMQQLLRVDALLCTCSSRADGGLWGGSDRTGPAAGPGSDPAAAGALRPASPAAAESPGSAEEGLPVSRCFQHHHAAFLSQGKTEIIIFVGCTVV